MHRIPSPAYGESTMSMRNIYRRHPAFVLLLWDVLLAVVMWYTAFVLQGLLWRWPLSAIAITNIVPSVVVWVWMRAALGLYPGYGLDEAEEYANRRWP
jgi:hypothetical protein